MSLPRTPISKTPVSKTPLPGAIDRDTAASPRWLSIVGIGEDGVDGLSAAARGLIGAAEIVYGGRRHLSLAAPLIRGAARPWPSPFDGAGDEVLRHVGERMLGVVRKGDSLARLGGDEFAICVLGGRSIASAIASRLMQSLREPVACLDREILRIAV